MPKTKPPSELKRDAGNPQVSIRLEPDAISTADMICDSLPTPGTRAAVLRWATLYGLRAFVENPERIETASKLVLIVPKKIKRKKG